MGGYIFSPRPPRSSCSKRSRPVSRLNRSGPAAHLVAVTPTTWLRVVLGLWPLLAGAQTQKFATQFRADAPEVPAAVRAPAVAPPWTGAEAGPVAGLREFARERSGAIWLGNDAGAARFDPTATHRWDRWQYFAGRRWLADDAVQAIVVDERAPPKTVWVRTRSGVARWEWRPLTLAQKAQAFEDRIDARHVRHGMVGSTRLHVAGDLSTSVTHDNDNDGLWTAMYLGAEAFRFAATKEPAARVRARRSLDLLMRLEEITGIPGFPARSFVSVTEPKPKDGEWHPTADGRWLWKGDTSSDEMVGHYYAYARYYDLVADEAEKVAIRRVVARITDHLIRNDYNLVDLDGQPTRWGVWGEAYFQTEEGKYEAPLRCLELLSFLKTAHHLTGDAKYAAAYDDRVRRGYAEQMRHYRRWPGGGEINFSDDELAYLSYDPLLRYEREPKLRAIYVEGLAFTWQQIQPDLNPLWNFISAASGAGPLTPALRDDARRTLERIPVDLISWTVKNAHRRDLTRHTDQDRFEKPQLTAVLAPDERPIAKWNANPYVPDGGAGGTSEDDGAFFLLPYWMGRYHGWIQD